MQGSFSMAWVIGSTYVSGLALLGVIMLIRGKQDEREVEGDSFNALVATMASKGAFSPAMRANPDRINDR